MFIKRLFLLLFICCTCYVKGYAQAKDFCNAVNAIIRDAPNKFRNIRGRMIESNMNATMWAVGIKVPGAIGTRLVSSMGLFYEGAFYQTKNKEELKTVYEKYKNLLTSCLASQGYKLSKQPNFYPGLGDYKKLVFMKESGDDGKTATAPAHASDSAPPHIAMEADYSKESGKYTIVMFIFEH